MITSRTTLYGVLANQNNRGAGSPQGAEIWAFRSAIVEGNNSTRSGAEHARSALDPNRDFKGIGTASMSRVAEKLHLQRKIFAGRACHATKVTAR
jgi:hypothetical protein